MIAIVEDDNNIREIVGYTLKSAGFSPMGFSCGKDFFESLREGIPDLVLLDIMLPGEDGLSILKRLKGDFKTKKIPVIMLTARDSEFDKVVGLDSGADDYITKPFGMMELLSRIRAVLRRSEGDKDESLLINGEISLDDGAHRVTVNGKFIELTLKEYSLLKILLSNSGRVMTRDILLEKVWGYDYTGETRTVDVHIRTLRTKLGAASEVIETIRGVGYRIGGADGK